MPYTILLTFDVEDWFQVQNFKQCIPFSSWPACELRVEKNVHRILDLLDSINTPNASRLAPNGSIKGTFFILGWIAERIPNLVREIQSRGHEIASHGYGHELCCKQSSDELRVDLVKSKELLEDIAGTPVYGYRAPSFSISDHVLELIRDAGYLYDSSFNSFGLNKRYGKINLNGNGGKGILYRISETFYEIPISNIKIGGKVLPWGGGGYFRLIPSKLFKHGVQSILKKHGAYLFYMHPWEIDKEQPRVSKVSGSLRFRHYVNLDKTYSKLSNHLNSFKNYRFSTCFQFITQ
jgi:polysaccharide deacetylase family protein (PEP-CTERM system associated)